VLILRRGGGKGERGQGGEGREKGEDRGMRGKGKGMGYEVIKCCKCMR